jgi:SAM-dependent methyltransferase
MSSISKYDYLFSEAPTEAHRLNIQQQTFDYLFAPHNLIFDTDIDLDKLHNILDVATGTGIWLQRLKERGQAGQKLPSDAKLAGCDITLDHLDADLGKKSQATFFVQDILEPFPPSEHSKYDYVQLRFVLMAMNVTTYRRALANLQQVVRPGGTIQVLEFDPRPPESGKPADTWARTTLTELWEMSDKDPTAICNGMHEHLASAGFDKIQVIQRQWPWGRPVAASIGLPDDIAASSAANAAYSMKALRPIVLRLAQAGKPVARVETAEQFDANWEDLRRHYLEDGHITTLFIGTARRAG